jgi:polyphenol oxidase
VFAFRDAHRRVDVAFTDCHRDLGGGPSASLGPADTSLDLAGPADRCTEDLRLVADALARGHADREDPSALSVRTPPPHLATMHQVHGATVAVVDQPALSRHGAPVADALVTSLPGVALLVRVADCVPVLLADATAGVVAAVHAGRPGLVAGVVPEAVRAMRARGATSIRAWVGPHVCGSCYEVPESMREEVAATVRQAWAETSWGTPSVDIGAGVRAQLRQHDVHPVVDVQRCTLEDPDLYSYRRQGNDAGRLGGLVWIRP